MNLSILSGCANPSLASAVARHLDLQPIGREISRFPDDELRVELRESVRSHDVYIVQPSSPPADARLFELFLLADACRRAGADRVTAVMPYFGYARQDRRAAGREPVTARLVADLIQTAHIDRVVAVDLHSSGLEGFFGVPLEHLSAVPQLASSARPWIAAEGGGVIVAPDLGAAGLAGRYAASLDFPVAIILKERLSGEEVRVRHVIGEVRGRAPIIVDDMISTAGTIEAAAKALLEEGCEPLITVVATHGLLVGRAIPRLSDLPIHRIVMSDSVAGPTGSGLPLERVTLAPLLSEAIRRLHRERSLGNLLVHE